MTEPTPLPPDDHELEQFLSRRSDLSQRYRSEVGADAAGEGAPPELDAPMLAQARAELQRPPLRSRRFLRWGRPLAVAATLVLVVSLGWMAQQKPLPQQVAFTPVAPAVSKESAAPAVDAAAAPAAAQAEEVKKQAIATQAPAEAAQQQAPARSVNLPAPSPKEPVSQYDRAASAASPSPSPPPSLPAAVISQPAAPAAVGKPAAPESRERVFAQRREAPQQQPAKGFVAEADSAPAAALTAKAATAPAPFAPAPAPLGMTTPVTVAPAASLAAAPNPCAGLPSRGAAQDRVQAGGSTDATAWLEQIRRLRDAEDLKGARAELACFSYLHAPGEVPDDLKALLPGAP